MEWIRGVRIKETFHSGCSHIMHANSPLAPLAISTRGAIKCSKRVARQAVAVFATVTNQMLAKLSAQRVCLWEIRAVSSHVLKFIKTSTNSTKIRVIAVKYLTLLVERIMLPESFLYVSLLVERVLVSWLVQETIFLIPCVF